MSGFKCHIFVQLQFFMYQTVCSSSHVNISLLYHSVKSVFGFLRNSLDSFAFNLDLLGKQLDFFDLGTQPSLIFFKCSVMLVTEVKRDTVPDLCNRLFEELVSILITSALWFWFCRVLQQLTPQGYLTLSMLFQTGNLSHFISSPSICKIVRYIFEQIIAVNV